MNIFFKGIVLCCFSFIISCTSEPQVERTVYDTYVLDKVVAILDEKNIDYTRDNNKLFYDNKDKDLVNGIFLDAYQKYSPKYVVYEAHRRDKFSMILNDNNIVHQIIPRPNNGYGFLIQSDINNHKLRELFTQSLEKK